MTIQDTDISIMLVRNCIGCPYTDLGMLVAKALSGGTSGYAFNIAENGSNVYDGTLIDGAEPYWNRWSTNQPGFWYMSLDVSDFTNSKLLHRLKYDSSEKYYFSLGSFAGMNTAAKAPSISDAEEQINAGNTEVEVKFTINYNFGNYDWRTVDSGHQYYKVVATKQDYPEVILGTSAVNSLPSGDGTTRSIIVTTTVSNSVDSYGTTKPTIGQVKAYLCDSSGSSMVLCPNMTGNLSLVLSSLSTITGSIYIDGEISMTNKLTGGTQDSTTYEHDAIVFNSKTLRDLESDATYKLSSIQIDITSKTTGSSYLSYNRNTSAAYVDQPKTLLTNKGGMTEVEYSFVCDLLNSGFDLPSNGYLCNVKFYYVLQA